MFIDELIESVGTGHAPPADQRIDVGGRCVLPGFVDSHSHLVCGGDRADEFAARMAGRTYEAGGIRTTVAATRAATDDELLVGATTLVSEARQSGTTTIEIKSGYGLTAAHEARALRVARQLTDDTTFLGAHVVPAEFDDRVDDYVAVVCGEMLAECAPYSRWIDAFCERGAFDADQCRAVLNAGREAGLGLRLHANQLGHGPGVQLAVELGCASADHCTYLSADDIAALAASDTVATFTCNRLLGTAMRCTSLLDAGGRAVGVELQPRLERTTSIPFCIASRAHAHDHRRGPVGCDGGWGGCVAASRHRDRLHRCPSRSRRPRHRQPDRLRLSTHSVGRLDDHRRLDVLTGHFVRAEVAAVFGLIKAASSA